MPRKRRPAEDPAVVIFDLELRHQAHVALLRARDARIAQLEAEVADLKRQLAEARR